MSYLLIIAGFVLLIVGGDTLVKGAVSIARRLGWSELLIGLTMVSIGTSAPELFTNIESALKGVPGIAVGNVIGSNIANILLVLGVTAIVYPVSCPPYALKRDGRALLVATLLFVMVTIYGFIPRGVGILFVALLAAYTVFLYRKETGSRDASAALHEHEAQVVPSFKYPLWVDVLITCAGIALTALGAKLLVSGASDIASTFGMSDTVIGITVVAIGTSLPELVTSIMAARQKATDVALGNIVGSNMTNILGVLGATAIISPLEIAPVVLNFDIWVVAATTLLLLFFAKSEHRICRREGTIFLGLYIGYIATQLGGFSGFL